MINLTEYLENTASRYRAKTAFSDGGTGLTFGGLRENAARVGSFFAALNPVGSAQPIAVLMERGAEAVAAFFGVLYSGNFYVPLDTEQPSHRIALILKKIKPKAIICREKSLGILKALGFGGSVFLYDDIIESTPVNEASLLRVRERSIDTDPAYVVVTSGSTGTPKGVVASHRAVIDYIDHLSNILHVTEDTVFGNQAPLYVDACLKELICTIKHGAATLFIPKSLFMFPVKLVEYLNAHKVNTICWVASALAIVSDLGALDASVPGSLSTIAFGSEVLSPKQLQKWRAALPNARFINLYGPTEATGMSCYYEITDELLFDEPIPIGRPFPNTRVFLLDGDERVAEPGRVGEICISGTRLSLGYYNDLEKTRAAFVQNPLNEMFNEPIYRTGDLARYNNRGELVFLGRKDFQIKHMGHRIELAEIEAAANEHAGVSLVCCCHLELDGKIYLFYTGTADFNDLAAFLRERLPRWMLPAKITKLSAMPLSDNMKIDRQSLKRNAKEM